MRDLNRSVPTAMRSHHHAEHNEFCVCRVIEDCALIKIDSLAKLRAAEKYMRRIASHVPGSYVVFSNRSKRVLGKVVSHPGLNESV
jgi:hypothetical protein